jgi:hypothetical protein
MGLAGASEVFWKLRTKASPNPGGKSSNHYENLDHANRHKQIFVLGNIRSWPGSASSKMLFQVRQNGMVATTSSLLMLCAACYPLPGALEGGIVGIFGTRSRISSPPFLYPRSRWGRSRVDNDAMPTLIMRQSKRGHTAARIVAK